jgi:DNA-binding LacI/PurR family transcriptional regulator
MTHIWFAPDGFEPVVTFDPAPGIHEAVQHLAGLGHRRITWLGIETEHGVELPERRRAFCAAALEADVEPVEQYLTLEPRAGDPEKRTVSRFHQELRRRPGMLRDTTAVICLNDAMATGLSLALREQGRRVPEDVSLVGFDDTQAIYAAPPLTTVSHSFMEMGRAAVRYLDELIESGEDRTEKEIRVPSRLVVRESTARPRTSNEVEGT